jgi:large subunit ribosomal protein L23
MTDIYQVIQTIRLTEKATLLGEKNNDYVFVVHPEANRVEIKDAVQKLFGKTVINVRTLHQDGKLRRKRTAHAGRSADWKKAYVRLKAGERIDLV